MMMMIIWLTTKMLLKYPVRVFLKAFAEHVLCDKTQSWIIVV